MLLGQTLDRMREASDDAFAQAEEAFHRTLSLVSGNRFLASALESLHPVIARVRRERAADRDAAVVRAHERIMAALGERDATATAAAVDAYGKRLASWIRA